MRFIHKHCNVLNFTLRGYCFIRELTVKMKGLVSGGEKTNRDHDNSRKCCVCVCVCFLL